MGVDNYCCDVCDEIVTYECVITDLYEFLFCMNYRVRCNVELTEEEKELLPQEMICSHTICIDCSPLHNFYEKESIYDDYALCVIDHFEDALEKYRKDKNKQFFQEFIENMKCKKCKEDQQKEEVQNKHNELKTKLEDIINTITKLKKGQIKEKLIQLKNKYIL